MTTMRKLLATVLLAIATVASAQTTNLKVMSFNIRFDTPKDTGIISWKNRCQPCADVIHHVQPDVIGMQEPRGPQYEQIIATLPDYTYLRIPLGGEVTEKKSGRIMVFFKTDKYEMKKWGYFWLTEKYEHPGYSFETTDRGNIRAAIWVKLKDKQTGRQFFFLTTHLPYKRDKLDDSARMKCAQLIVDRMKAIAGEKVPLFVTGDMNASWQLRAPRRNSLLPFYQWMCGAREMSPITDAHSSFNGWQSTQDRAWPNNIDHIFYRNAQPLRFVTHDEPNYGVPYVSDHYPIVCDFTF